MSEKEVGTILLGIVVFIAFALGFLIGHLFKKTDVNITVHGVKRIREEGEEWKEVE